MTLKRWANAIAKKMGITVKSIDRLGLDVETDLSRLSTADPLKTIFDVGGNFGQTARRFADEFPAATVFTFEPVPQSYERLVRRVGQHRRIKMFNLAVGNVSGPVKMNLSPDDERSSLLSKGCKTDSIEVQAETLDSIAELNAIATIDLLKIDVEGFELQVIEGGRKLFEAGRVRFVFAECVLSEDLDAPHTSFFDLHQVLEHRGFCFVNYYAESFHLRSGCALGNVLYALRAKLPDRVPGRVQNIW